jgi:hypothetical protein
MGVNAQQTFVEEGLTYYENKREAFEAATVQGKLVFLFWGSADCPKCMAVKKNLGHSSLRSILDEHYILWYSDARTYSRDAPEVVDYLSEEPRLYVPYPALCIIDTADVTKGYGFVAGLTLTVAQLYGMLNEYMYVANAPVSNPDGLNRVYVSGGTLVVEGFAADEEIRVYASTGLLVDRFRKREQRLTRDVSLYPAGILVVAGSSGWARKVVAVK